MLTKKYIKIIFSYFSSFQNFRVLHKPKVSYFRVFGCKCFILNKRPKTSKFAPKVDEGILLGYGSNEHAYRVFNKIMGRVEVTIDVTFDESNGSE
jgi:hypothetical protein